MSPRFTEFLWVSHYYFTVSHPSNYTVSVLHPKHKLEYFCQAGWLPEWIKTTESLVHDEFNKTYKDRAQGGEDEDDEHVSSSGVSENHSKVSQLNK